jgi:hypothetical protein
VVAAEAVAVLEMEVPTGWAGLVATTSVKTLLPMDMLAIEQVIVPVAPTAGVVHDQPPGGVSETNVVTIGNVSVSETLVASLGPALLTVMVYVMLFPGVTGSGESVFVTERSAAPVPTVVVSVSLSLPLFGSGVVDVIVAVLLRIVPPATDAFTLTVNVKTALPMVMFGFVHVIVPIPPTGGVVQVQPPGATIETKVVSAGTESVSERLVASLGPALFTVIV